MMKQPDINIGLIGHVSHGKSSFIRAMSGKTTMTHSKEKVRNSTVNLGYANMQVGETFISFIDCPGHEAYMSHMLSGVPLMDLAFLVVDATDEKVLQSQAEEHLAVLCAMGVKQIYVLQNKVDLLDKTAAVENRKRILSQLAKYNFNTQIYPISAQFGLGLDILKPLFTKSAENEIENQCLIMPIVRSFDINKPSEKLENLKGGVIGGSITNGKVSLGDTLLIIPGLCKDNTCYPFIVEVRDICSEQLHLQSAHKGGLIALQLDIDPYYTKNNLLTGQTLFRGKKEDVNVYRDIELKTTIFREGIILEGNIRVHCMNNLVDGVINEKNGDCISVKLAKPIVIMPDWKVCIFCKWKNQWKFFYTAQLIGGEKMDCSTNYQFTADSYIPKECKYENPQEFNAKIYNKQLRQLYEQMDDLKREKMAMIYPKIAHNGNNTIWINYNETVNHILQKTKNTREEMEKLLLKLLKSIFDNNIDYLENGLQIGKKIQLQQFMEFLKIFKLNYLECNACKSCQTYYSKKVKKCTTCNFEKHFT